MLMEVEAKHFHKWLTHNVLHLGNDDGEAQNGPYIPCCTDVRLSYEDSQHTYMRDKSINYMAWWLFTVH